MNHLRTLLIALWIFINPLSAQDLDIVEVQTPIYKVTYSQLYQQPILVEYTVICLPTSRPFPRGGIDFTRNDSIKTSTGSDYADNIWDKGHMAPANTFACREDWLKLTFSYLNCALQHQNLNRGAWATLEAFERDLAMLYEDVEVRIEVYFSEDWTENSDPARIPASFVKSITWTEDNKQRTISFDFPNKSTGGKSFWHYLID